MRRNLCWVAVVGSVLVLQQASATAGIFTVVASFYAPHDGYTPYSGAQIDSQGNLYGTTANGGTSNVGIVWKVANGSNTIQRIDSFNGTNGATPLGGVAVDPHGNLFGTAFTGLANNGTVWEIAQGSQTIQALSTFTGSNGATPVAGVTIDQQGNLFGTTNAGGPNNGSGTVWEIPHGTNALQTLAAFRTNGPYGPVGGVALDSHGNLFGTTASGGANGRGTVWEIDQGTKTFHVLAPFTNAAGDGPATGIVIDSQGNIFGTSSFGGTSDLGTVWELGQGSNAIQTLASFNGTNGARPQLSGLALDSAGNLFGVTPLGGEFAGGALWEVAHGSNNIQVVHSFDSLDGALPYGVINFDSSGDLWGTTINGGAYSNGALWELKADAPHGVPAPSSLMLLTMGAVSIAVVARCHRWRRDAIRESFTTA